MKGDKSKIKRDTGHGYWMYKDGYSYWGIGLYKENDTCYRATEKLHKSDNLTAKLRWYGIVNKRAIAKAKADAATKGTK